MGRKRNKKSRIDHARRLKELKNKLKKYRDRETVNCLRLITGSSRVNLNKYWESLESVFTTDHTHRDVKERIQSVVNKILENGEYGRSTTVRPDSMTDVVIEEMKHVLIDSKLNKVDNVNHDRINLTPGVLDKERRVHINSTANMAYKVKHFHINSTANMVNKVYIIDPTENVLDKLVHFHIQHDP